MKIIGKIIALPFILALTILVAVLQFLTSISSGIFAVGASLLAFLAVATLVMAGGDAYSIRSGIMGLVLAFLVSPFGLPAIAVWIAGLLDGVNYCLKSFLTS